jgi:hypothetical protein
MHEYYSVISVVIFYSINLKVHAINILSHEVSLNII